MEKQREYMRTHSLFETEGAMAHSTIIRVLEAMRLNI